MSEFGNNKVVKIKMVSVPSVLRRLDKMVEMKHGVFMMKDLVSAIGKECGSGIYGGVGYDYKSIYTYMIDPDPIAGFDINGNPVCVGAFLRYDDTRRIVVVRAVMYVPNKGTLFVLDRSVQRTVVYERKEEDKVRGIFVRYREEIDKVIGLMASANDVKVSDDAALSWMEKAFHNFARSDVIRAMFAASNRSMWSLYYAIARYYSKQSNTPYMQFWNVMVAERLILDPVIEERRATAYVKSTNDLYAEIFKDQEVLA